MYNHKPKIVKRGDNPKCVHYEAIVGYVGTCLRCGQVRDYSICDPEKDSSVNKKKAKAGGLKAKREAAAYV